MQRKTKYLVYVDKGLMDKADDLIDAVMSHFVKVDLDTSIRKQFLSEAGKAILITNTHALKVIDEWVQIRDIKGFPFRKKEEEILTETIIIEEKDENTEIEGGVPVDNGADEEPESGTASE